MKRQELNQIFRYLVVGGIATGIDFGCYTLFSEVGNIDVAKTFSMLIAMVVSFFLNRLWTFNNRQTINRQVKRYIIVQIVNLTMNVSINGMVFWIAENKLIAFIFATSVAMCVNYLLQKKYVFV